MAIVFFDLFIKEVKKRDNYLDNKLKFVKTINFPGNKMNLKGRTTCI